MRILWLSDSHAAWRQVGNNRTQMLGTPSILGYSPKGSENPSGAVDQQGKASNAGTLNDYMSGSRKG